MYILICRWPRIFQTASDLSCSGSTLSRTAVCFDTLVVRNVKLNYLLAAGQEHFVVYSQLLPIIKGQNVNPLHLDRINSFISISLAQFASNHLTNEVDSKKKQNKGIRITFQRQVGIWVSLNGGAFCRFYRIMRNKKSSSKMLPPVGVEPRAYDFHTLHATILT